MTATSSMPEIQAFNFPSGTSGGTVAFAGAAPSIILGASAINLLAWVNLASATTITMTAFSVPDVISLGVQTGANGPELTGVVVDSQGTTFTVTGGSVPTDQWVMLQLIWGSGQTLVGMVNGVQVGSVAVSAYPLAKPSSTNTYVGGPWDGSIQPFAGMIQSVFLGDKDDPTESVWGYAVMPTGAISNWGSSAANLQGSAATVTLTSAPSTAFGGLYSALPPAPTSLSDPQPQTADSGPAFYMVVPSGDTSTFTMLSISQNWSALLALLAAPDTITQHQVSVTTGVDVSSSETQTVGVSLGLTSGFDIGLLSAQLNLTLSYSVSFTQTVDVSEQTTVTNTEEIDNPPVETLGWWWQGIWTATTISFTNYDSNVTTATMPNPGNEIASMSYPVSSQSRMHLVSGRPGQSAVRAAE